MSGSDTLMGWGARPKRVPRTKGVTTMEHLKKVSSNMMRVTVEKAEGKQGFSGIIEVITEALAGLKEPEEPAS